MLLSWIVCTIGIVGTILNVKQNKWCFALWIVSNTCLIFLNFKAAPAQSALFTVYLATSIWGWVAWTKAEKAKVKA
jgi:nicotinamide riboside transporter PnuC